MSQRLMSIRMMTTSRSQQRDDHWFRDLVQHTGDLTIAADLGVLAVNALAAHDKRRIHAGWLVRQSAAARATHVPGRGVRAADPKRISPFAHYTPEAGARPPPIDRCSLARADCVGYTAQPYAALPPEVAGDRRHATLSTRECHRHGDRSQHQLAADGHSCSDGTL